MDDRLTIKKLAAGIFFVLGIALFAVCVFVIGMDRGMTQPKFQVLALFKEAGGLIQGAPIRISGINVGVVSSVDFLQEPIEGRSIKVTLNIFKKYEFQFRKCSRISIKTEGVLGQKLVEISEDHNKKMFDVSMPIIGEDPLDVEDMAGVITRTAVSLEKTTQNVNNVVGEWKYISHKSRRILNRLEEKLINGDLFKIF